MPLVCASPPFVVGYLTYAPTDRHLSGDEQQMVVWCLCWAAGMLLGGMLLMRSAARVLAEHDV